MTNTTDKFVIIDAMAIAYKSYFAFINRPLSTSSGEPVSAVYGFLMQLIKILEDTKPEYIAIAFDSKEKTVRHEKYDLYKSSRAKMPEDMVPQIQRIKDLIDLLKMKLYILPGYEADDIVGTAVKKAESIGLTSYCITPDKDYVQLITKNTHLIIPGKSGEEVDIINHAKATEKYGFTPEYMVDYLALIGDSSDDIPGVAGIGPKSATPLIQEYGHLESIYKNIENIAKKGVRTKLENDKEKAFLSKDLATIITDVPLEISIEETKIETPDFTKVEEFTKSLEFKNIIPRLKKIYGVEGSEEIEEVVEQKVESFDNKKANYKLITTEKDAKDLVNKLLKQKLFVFDTETDGLDVLNINLAGVAFSYKANEAYFVATDPKKDSSSLFSTDISERMSIETFKNIFTKVFENDKIKKVCQNGKYDIAVLRTYGISVNNFFFDTMLASYVVDPDQKHGMDALSTRLLNYTPIPISEIIGDGKNAERIFEADLNKLSDYSSEDADITYRLYEKLNASIKENNLENVVYEIEFPLVPVLEDMERTGIKLDTKNLKLFSTKLSVMLNEFTEKIHGYAGVEFNINSTKQLQEILFEKLQLPKTKKTKTGFSTDARSLEGLKGSHEIIDLILEYRQVAKLRSTYADALPNLINENTGRIHTTFNQTVAATGRLSSVNPNLQNIPIRTELGKEIRKAFIPTDDNHVILSADYSQIELRIMASICNDENLLAAFNNDEDIHKSTAAHVFEVKLEEVTADMRRKAKEVNFGILYGIGPFGLKNRLGITQAHAKEIIETYFSTFKNVKSFMDSSIEFAKENGYAKTLSGRRRFLNNINSKNAVVRQFEERVAINMPIQGTAADMIKIAMIKIYTEMNKQKLKSKMVLQVHDELLFDVPKDEVDVLKELVITNMENAMEMNVPLKVEAGIGDNWLEAH